MLWVRINRKERRFLEGISILEALRAVGEDVPTLCHDERLKPYGACRLCIVNVEGLPHPVTACNTLLAEGMKIETHPEEIEKYRRTLLKLLAQNYPAEPVEQYPVKEFHHYLRHYKLESELRGSRDPDLRDDSHPHIHVDMSQCVYCYRCVRICDEVQGQSVWQVWNRGYETQIRPDGKTLLESSCVGCGACVDTCPTGALEDKSVLTVGLHTEWTRTTCPYCGTGCEMDMAATENRVVAARPARDTPVSRGHLCIKGRYGFDFAHARDRITEPMIRQRGVWEEVGWDQAIEFVAREMKRLLDEHGPDSIAVLGSARATNEENYLTQKFARLALGTNNVDCCARVCHTPTAAAMKMMLGTGAATNSFNDIERARTILICGANPTENHPVVGARIKQAALNGAKLIVIDPRVIELAEYSDIHLQLRPGTNIPLLNAMCNVIVEEKLYDESFIGNRVSEWDEFCEFVRAYSPDEVSEICGVDAESIRESARLYATAKPAMCFHGLGVTEHTQGTEGVMGLVNLALITGNLGRRGAGINPLRGQNNVQGSAHMGCDPGTLTGGVSISDAQHFFEEAWGASLPASKGLNLIEMMDAAEAGRLKAMWIIGYDVLLTNANAETTRRAFKSLGLVIIQDMFLNETAREFGTVFFPAASSFEKNGTFMNAERRIQLIRKIIDPPGESKADWEIICDVARAMGKGKGFDFNSAEDIWNEVRAVWNGSYGITYSRIEQAGLQWPCPSEDHPGTEVLHAETFPIGKQAALRRIKYRPTAEITDEEFPFMLTTGRTLYHFNAGTMTMRTANTALRPTDLLDISRSDASRFDLRDGDRVRLRSRYGEAIIPIHISERVMAGELFATFHTREVFLNQITSTHRDRFVKAPEYKVTAVRIEKV